MKILFYGSSDVSGRVLKKLFETGKHQIEVISSCDKPRGRGLKVRACEVTSLADQLGLKSYQPKNVKDEAFIKQLSSNKYDLGVVVAFGKLLSCELISLPEKGTINLHFSKLPEYRGAAPYKWALINGEKKTGVTIMYVEEKLDAGDIILQEEVLIEDGDDGGTLLEKLIETGGKLLLEAVKEIELGTADRKKQPEVRVSYFGKLPKNIGKIDWNRSSAEIHNLVRGLAPEESASTRLHGKLIKINKTEVFECILQGRPGEIIKVEKGKGLVVAAGSGAVLIKRIKPEGRQEMDIEAYARGNKIEIGVIFERGL
ncbi:MAG: methionyl-tRNA formyltransferase [Candidatus Firestonebacteria bacterium]|nr:methionyl-tRNA formyltransferase [Candidatus Firestonebacteria bacterium]